MTSKRLIFHLCLLVNNLVKYYHTYLRFYFYKINTNTTRSLLERFSKINVYRELHQLKRPRTLNFASTVITLHPCIIDKELNIRSAFSTQRTHAHV